MANIKGDFAVNKVKLAQSVKALEDKKKIDPTVEINEDTVQDEYEKRAGLVHPAFVRETDKTDSNGVTTPKKRGRKAVDNSTDEEENKDK